VKESSFYTIVGEYEKHILPYFSDMRITDITPYTIIAWQSTLNGYSFKYRKMLNVNLGAVLKFGARYYDLPNPMLKTEPLRNIEQKKEIEIWSYDEFQKFLSVVDDDLYRCLFRFLYITGCRKGESRLFQYYPEINVQAQHKKKNTQR